MLNQALIINQITNVYFTLDRLGAQKFGRTTTDNVGKQLAIVLDGKLLALLQLMNQ